MSTKNIPVDILGLSNRSQNALHRAQIHTLEELLMYDEESLSKIRNLGQKSIEEILKVIRDYKNGELQLEEKIVNPVISFPKVFDEWIREKESQEFVLEYYSSKGTKIDEIELLSAKTYNRLMINEIIFLEQILFKTKQELLSISRMEEQMADEIIRLCACFVKADEKNIERVYVEKQKELNSVITSMPDKRFIPEYQDVIEKYVKQNDIEIQFSVLSNRPKNQLLKNGFEKLSDIVFISKEELQRLPAMGNGSVMEVLEFIGSYLIEHEQRIMALWHGDESVLFSDDVIKEKILKL